jgi:hypothetical protein
VGAANERGDTVIGLYIDSLTDEQRDRIIEAQKWSEWALHDLKTSERCLVGHAEQESRYKDTTIPWVPYRFTELCIRFGKDRAVALCKARAAKNNRVAPTHPGLRKRPARSLTGKGATGVTP